MNAPSRTRVLAALSLVLLLLIAFTSRAAETLGADHVKVEILAPKSFARGTTTTIGIHFKPDEHWHVYWKNPGDSGAAPKFKFAAEGAELGEVQWPLPKRLPVAHLTNFGYEGEVVYPVQVMASGNKVKLTVNLEWLVCQEECVPGFGELTIERPVTDGPSVWEKDSEALVKKFEASVPRAADPAQWEIATSPKAMSQYQVTLEVPEGVSREQIDIFPVTREYLAPSTPERKDEGDKIAFTFITNPAAEVPSTVDFVVSAGSRAFEFANLPNKGTLKAAAVDLSSLAILLASAFLGGILLNLMPCVFPVISIKALSLMRASSSKERVRDGVHYSLGVLVTFLALGGGFLALRGLGNSVGWGFQLQSPLVILALVLLFWLMALNFLGVFEFGTSIMSAAGSSKRTSSFASGILSVFVAAPCTGPFMGTALGAASTLPSLASLGIFLALGAGLAAPYLLLAMSPQLARRLPKPGAWMETLKQFLAFPLFATVLWLLWVLGQQTGTSGWLQAGGLLLGISFALWIGTRGQSFSKVAAWAIAVVVIVNASYEMSRADVEPTTASAKGDWLPYSDEKLAAARAAGQPVFVDFTAAWCITCQVNKKVVLETAAADEIFSNAKILRLRADWTKQDPKITEALARLGRNSVPVYAFYPAGGGEPRLLPQVLTINMIRDLTTDPATKESK